MVKTPLNNTVAPNVGYLHPSYLKALEKYITINDVVEGESAIKSKGTRYLPMVNTFGDLADVRARYEAYLLRAVFYPATARTLEGLKGQLLSKGIESQLPESLQSLVENTTGTGIDIEQFAGDVVYNVLKLGRGLLLPDFSTENDTTLAAKESLKGRICFYDATQIINWKTYLKDNVKTLKLIVIKDKAENTTDGFNCVFNDFYKVLALDEAGLFYVENWYIDANQSNNQYTIDRVYPVKADGTNFDYIPATFVGSKNNDWNIDKSPIEDLANYNLKHYMNSADYEESLFMVAQPTPWIAGLTPNWVEEVLKNKIPLGSRGYLLLPEGATTGLNQVSLDAGLLPEIEHKERVMVALGARLMEADATNVTTATEVNSRDNTSNSDLSLVGKNVSQALSLCLKFLCDYTGDKYTPEEMYFELNTEAALQVLSAQDLTAVVANWQSGILSFTEARAVFRAAGQAFEEDDLVKQANDEERALKQQEQLQLITSKQPVAQISK